VPVSEGRRIAAALAKVPPVCMVRKLARDQVDKVDIVDIVDEVDTVDTVDTVDKVTFKIR
jgi:hypothetical protein